MNDGSDVQAYCASSEPGSGVLDYTKEGGDRPDELPVKNIGVSNFGRGEISEIVALTAAKGLVINPNAT